LSQVEVVSFFPLDVAQAGVRLTPGVIATQGIEALGSGAKLLAETIALLLVVLTGAAAGGIVARFRLQRAWSNILPLAALAMALIALAQTLAGRLPDAASTVILRSVTGYADAIPLDRALDRRSLVVYGFTRQALTREHGFPARVILPGLYGMKNVKWLSAIEVVDQEYRGYWEQRGWDPSADVRTQSTIDTGNRAVGNAESIRSDNGLVVLGGYAFAGIRGISSVDLNIDNSGWQSVQLKEPSSDIAWRPWRYAWQAPPGEHVVTVRATDGRGVVQSADSLPPHPSGASGWHTLRLRVDS
jgi:hypothetical protein